MISMKISIIVIFISRLLPKHWFTFNILQRFHYNKTIVHFLRVKDESEKHKSKEKLNKNFIIFSKK